MKGNRNMNESRTDAEWIQIVAAYDTLREGANQLIGALNHRLNATDDPEEKERWRAERRAVRRRVDAVSADRADQVEEVTEAILQRLNELEGEMTDG
jgi:hypothetical protein